MTPPTRLVRAALSCALSILLAACGGGTEPSGELSLQIVGGDEQRAVVGTELPQALVARVVDADGDPVAGQVVNFRVVSGGGSVFAGSGASNAEGIVRERWTLGTSTADSQRVEARAVDPATGDPIVFAVFTATALPDAPVAIERVAGDSQTVASGSAGDSLAVRALDRYGNPTSGVSVAWEVVDGGGTVDPTSSLTGDDGVARTAWRLGSVGWQHARASAAELGAVEFAGRGTTAPVAFTEIQAGPAHACALGVDRIVYCWGLDDRHQLGTLAPVDGRCTTDREYPCSPRPLPVGGGMQFDRLVGPMCAARDGRTYCWGDAAVDGSSRMPVAMPEDVSGGLVLDRAWGDCGLVGTTAYCRGDNLAGQLGVGTMNDGSPHYVPVAGGHRFVSLGVGATTRCGVDDAGRTFCWGSNDWRQTGSVTGTVEATCMGFSGSRCTPVSTPLALPDDRVFDRLAVGSAHACGLTADGTAHCWGWGWLVGDPAAEAKLCGSFPCDTGPVKVAGDVRFATLSAGVYHTCGLTSDGAAYCWGNDVLGELGDGSSASQQQGHSAVPVPVAGGHRFRSIAAGDTFTCAIALDGAAYCWGYNAYGQLSLGQSDSQPHLAPERIRF